MSSYTGLKEVLAHNDEAFVKQFKKSRVMVRLSWAGSLLALSKFEVWRLAKSKKIIYRVAPCPPYRDRMILYDISAELRSSFVIKSKPHTQ
jgi:hypothetical protein